VSALLRWPKCITKAAQLLFVRERSPLRQQAMVGKQPWEGGRWWELKKGWQTYLWFLFASALPVFTVHKKSKRRVATLLYLASSSLSRQQGRDRSPQGSTLASTWVGGPLLLSWDLQKAPWMWTWWQQLVLEFREWRELCKSSSSQEVGQGTQ
jgi:hypothetical protein